MRIPNFDEALKRQREVFADRYTPDSDLAQYVDAMFNEQDQDNEDVK